MGYLDERKVSTSCLDCGDVASLSKLGMIPQPSSGTHSFIAIVEVVASMIAISKAFGFGETSKRDDMIYPAMENP